MVKISVTHYTPLSDKEFEPACFSLKTNKSVDNDEISSNVVKRTKVSVSVLYFATWGFS